MQRDAGLAIGVPGLFLRGGVRGRMPPGVPPDIARLVAEYRQARGHLFEWGQIVVTERPPLLTWRVVPVALREYFAIAVPPCPCRLCCRCSRRWDPFDFFRFEDLWI
jgi:hypothetical protein